MDLVAREASARDRLEACKARLRDLRQEPDAPLWKEMAYSVRVELPTITRIPAFGNCTTEQGWVFLCKEMQPNYEISGLLEEDHTSGCTIQIPESSRLVVFEYTWLVRDTGSNQPWSNLPVPSWVLRGGNMQGLRFIKGHRRVRGGSRIEFTINPTVINLSSGFTGVSSPTGHALNIALRGVAIRDDFYAQLRGGGPL